MYANAWRGQRTSDPLDSMTGDCEPSMWVLELNPGPLQEEQALLFTEPSIQSSLSPSYAI